MTPEQIDTDLRADAVHVEGALESRDALSPRRRERAISQMLRGEARREQFEALIVEAGLLGKWQGFPVTEQREFLAAIDRTPLSYLPTAWAMRRLVKDVRREPQATSLGQGDESTRYLS